MDTNLAVMIALIGVNIATVALASGFVLWAFGKLENDLKAQLSQITARLDQMALRSGLDQMTSRMDQMVLRMDQMATRTDIDQLTGRLDKMTVRIDQMQHSINEIDKRLYGVETVLHMKDCCVLKQDQDLKKTE